MRGPGQIGKGAGFPVWWKAIRDGEWIAEVLVEIASEDQESQPKNVFWTRPVFYSHHGNVPLAERTCEVGQWTGCARGPLTEKHGDPLDFRDIDFIGPGDNFNAADVG
jgi:hypothetical protein